MSIKVAESDLIRPTAVLLRRKLFDTYQDLRGFTFVDLCAGSAAVGIEAWSRGAAQLFLVEKNRPIFNTLNQNITMLSSKYGEEMERRPILPHNLSAQKWIASYRDNIYLNLSKLEKLNHIIFLDPPYNMLDLYNEIVEEEILGSSWFLGKLWIESDRQKGLPSDYWDKILKDKEKIIVCGDSYIFMADFSS